MKVMMKWLMPLLFISMLWWIVGCTEQTNTSVNEVSPLSSIATPLPDSRIPSVKEYTSTLTMPDGRSLPVGCIQVSVDIPHCYVTFPNGNSMNVTLDPAWSPDGQFAVICYGATHDSPCQWYEVWDVRNGEKIDVLLHSPFHQWTPNEGHILVYLNPSTYLGQQDELAAFDLGNGEKRYLDACPDWFHQQFPGPCSGFPEAIIGGQIFDLPDDVSGVTSIYSIDRATFYGTVPWQGRASWKFNLRSSGGTVYRVTSMATGYTCIPVSYTIQLSGTKAYVVVDGHITANEATHLDFHFNKIAELGSDR